MSLGLRECFWPATAPLPSLTRCSMWIRATRLWECNKEGAANSQIGSEGDQAAIFGDDGSQGDGKRLHLLFEGRVLGSLEHDFERSGVDLRGRGQDAVVMF